MDEQQNEPKGIVTRTATGIKGKAKVGEAAIENLQTAEASETEFKERNITQLVHCQCCGAIKTMDEVGGVDCITGDYLCHSCASIKCTRCLKSVGVESRIDLFGDVYCKRCAKRLGLYILVSFVAVIAVVCLILFS